MNLEQLAQLGRELKYRRLTKHVEKCRELYRVTRDRQGRAEWTLEHAARLASILQLQPNPMGVLARGAVCSECSPDPQANIASQTVTHLEDRFVQRCTRCGAEWVVLLRAV